MRINNKTAPWMKIIITRMRITPAARATEEKATEVVIEEENEAIRTINQLAQEVVLLVSDAV
jgi:hypothetical protein